VKKLCYIATIPAVVHAFLREHIQAASKIYEVTVICNSVDKHWLEGLNARLVLLPIERKPSPWSDIATLWQLIQYFRHERFDIVHSHMPKTGLLGMLAAWMARVPVRLHTFHGEVWATRSGLVRSTLKKLDQLVYLLATNVFVVSPSQREFLAAQHVLPVGKVGIVESGSICGVDSTRFRPMPESRQEFRERLGVSRDARIILFVGRLNADKGVEELAVAFNAIAREFSDVILLLVGTEEDTPFARIQEICFDVRERVRYVRFTATPESFMAAADIFCLPSHREGFGMTIIEAAACGIPAVASRIYGITDAVTDGETGLLFPVGDVNALTRSLQVLISDEALRKRLGAAARSRTLELFSSGLITRGMVALYGRLLGESVPMSATPNTSENQSVVISISVVSHSQIDLVTHLVNDFEKYCKDLQFEFLLTLNQYEVLPFRLDSYSFPIRVIRNAFSLGYGANHNQAFQRAVGRYFCVMNPDIRLHSNPFFDLLECLSVASVGVVAPLLFGTNGVVETSARHFPSPWKIFWKAFRGHEKPEYEITESLLRPDWVGGMFMLFPRHVFMQLRGFDERYFLYYEDVDICGRLRLSDYEVVLCPNSQVSHYAQRKSHSNFRFMRLHLRSMIRFFLSPVYRRVQFGSRE
jgi:glycosyltransferase involved in cell wall biosynthesis/GT2 family glycosyltransferase